MGANQLFGDLSAVPIAAQQQLNLKVCMKCFTESLQRSPDNFVRNQRTLHVAVTSNFNLRLHQLAGGSCKSGVGS
jgi:hypothetical protein